MKKIKWTQKFVINTIIMIMTYIYILFPSIYYVANLPHNTFKTFQSFFNCLNSGYTVTFYHKYTIENGYKSYIFIFQILSQGPIYKNKNRKEQSSHLHINFITNSQIIKNWAEKPYRQSGHQGIYHWVETKHGSWVLSVFIYSWAYHAFILTLNVG